MSKRNKTTLIHQRVKAKGFQMLLN